MTDPLQTTFDATQATLDDYDADEPEPDADPDPDVRTDGGRSRSDSLPGFDRRADGKPVAHDDWVGEYLYTSWGYNRTNVEIARITGVSDSGRTVTAKLAKRDREATHKTTEAVTPADPDPAGDGDEDGTYGDEFRLYVREGHRGDELVFRGSYPYVNGDMEAGARKDTFLPWGDRESVTQTAPNAGH